MQRRPRAGRPVCELARVGTRPLDHVLEGLERGIGTHGYPEHEPRDVDDVGEIADRVPRRLLHERQAEHGDRNMRNSVPVRLCGRGHSRGSGRAASPGTILDHDWLAEHLADRLTHCPMPQVDAGARGPGHDERDGLVGETGRGLRAHRRGEPTGRECTDSYSSNDAFQHDCVPVCESPNPCLFSVSRCARAQPAPEQ